MSWNLIILPPEDLDDVATLGDASDVRARLERVLSPIEWSDPGNGAFNGPGFRIEIALEPTGDIESFMLHVTGDADPVEFVAGACRANGWTIFDAVAGDYLDMDHPSNRGWTGYQAHIAGKVIPPDEQ